MCGSYLLLRTIKASPDLQGTLIKQCQVGNLVVVAAAVETVRADALFRQSDRFYSRLDWIELQGIDIHLLANALNQVAILLRAGRGI